MLKTLNFTWAVFIYLSLLPTTLFAECYSDYDQLVNTLNRGDSDLKGVMKDFFIEEQFLDEYGNIKDRNRLEEIPDKYRYSGSLYPNFTQQAQQNIEMKEGLSVAIDIRNISERVGDENKANYWFWQERGCWYLKQKTIHLVYVKPPEPETPPPPAPSANDDGSNGDELVSDASVSNKTESGQ